MTQNTDDIRATIERMKAARRDPAQKRWQVRLAWQGYVPGLYTLEDATRLARTYRRDQLAYVVEVTR